MHFIGVFNRDGGTFRTTDMEAFGATATAILAEHGHTIDVRPCAGEKLLAELRRAARDKTADVLLAGGGDGTVSAAAGICFENDKTLAVLPAGTMNLFARSLKIPFGLEEALTAIAAGSIRQVDIATANGVPFVHQYSVGLHARLVRMREGLTYSSRWGKILASVRAVAAAVGRPLVFDIEIRTPRGSEQRKAAAISVSNNLLGEGHVPFADALDQGVLGVYVVKPMPTAELAKLTLSLMLGHWKENSRVSEREVTQVTLTFPRRKASARAVIDGELVSLEPRVDLRIHPGALRVVLPLEEGVTDTASASITEAGA